jgi:hypothetical protein
MCRSDHPLGKDRLLGKDRAAEGATAIRLSVWSDARIGQPRPTYERISFFSSNWDHTVETIPTNVAN